MCLALAVALIIIYIKFARLKKDVSQFHKQQMDMAKSYYSLLEELGYDFSSSKLKKKSESEE